MQLIVKILCGLIAWTMLPLTSNAAVLPLRIATFNYPPYIYSNLSRPPTGVAVEIVETALGRMKTPIIYKYAPFQRSLAYMEHGQADALFTIRKTPERELNYHFSPLPLLTQDIVVFVRRDSPIHFTGNLHELSTYSIGVVQHASYGADFDKMAKSRRFDKLEIATSHEMNFRKLLANRMDIVLCSRKVGLEILKTLSSVEKVKTIGPPIGSYKSYIIFNKKTVSLKLVSDFNKNIMEMEGDGTLTHIKRKYDM